jgi:hypothetical protein
MEGRVAEILQAYDGQGDHRTGTEVDAASAEWLAGEVRAACSLAGCPEAGSSATEAAPPGWYRHW